MLGRSHDGKPGRRDLDSGGPESSQRERSQLSRWSAPHGLPSTHVGFPPRGRLVSTAVELVLAELELAGFQRLPRPLVVGGAVFDFDAAVTGTGVSHDLVVVGSQGADSVHLVQLLSGLNRSLDRFASRRPVSLIVIGCQPEPKTLAELEDNARVMVIAGELPEPADIRDAIAVLLPSPAPSPHHKGSR